MPETVSGRPQVSHSFDHFENLQQQLEEAIACQAILGQDFR